MSRARMMRSRSVNASVRGRSLVWLSKRVHNYVRTVVNRIVKKTVRELIESKLKEAGL